MKINWTLIWQEFDALASEDEGETEFHLTFEERKAVERLVNNQIKELSKRPRNSTYSTTPWDPRGHY